MRKLLLVSLLVGLSLSLVGIAEGNKQYRSFLGCGKYAGSSNFCIIGSGFGATFEVKSGKSTKYKLCVKTPVKKDCDKKRTNRHGKDFVPLYHCCDSTPGQIKATWKVGGDFAGRDKMVLGIGD